MDIDPCPYTGHVASLWKGRPISLHEGEYYQPESEGTLQRWRKSKQATTASMGAVNTGLSVAQQVTQTGVVALATGTAAASATGVGLVVGGAILSLASNALAVVSAHKTQHHLDGLRNILARPASFPCHGFQGTRNERQHTVIAVNVLPYIIEKKAAKYQRKVVAAVPVVSTFETLRAVGKNLVKRTSGTLHVNRHEAATWLAVHLITHNCGLAQAIVAELFSFREMLWLQSLDSEELIPLLMEKMRST